MSERDSVSPPPVHISVGSSEEAIEAAKMARTRLMHYATAVERGEVQGGGREFERRIWGAFSDFDQAVGSVSSATPIVQPSPAERAGTEERGIAIGMAIAAGIIMRSWGKEVYAREILGSAGLDTLEKLKASGVDQYDIDALMPAVSTATSEDQP